MALRTVTLEPETRHIALAPNEWRRRLERAANDLTAAIATGALDQVRAVFADVATWEAQRAYQAQRTLTEGALLASTAMSAARWSALYLTIAEALTEALDANPSEPVLLNYLGVLLYELADAQSAQALFRAVQRLDPDMEHIEDNLAQSKRAKPGLERLLDRRIATRARVLGTRARRIASTAQTAQGLTLSLTMIVKDEEEMLPGCLAAVKDAVDEIIVVDTGSSDRTVEIAKSFGAKVIEFPWNGSFSDARNVSLNAATGDWIMYLDADEHMFPEDAAHLRSLLGKTWREAFYLVETNYTGGEDAGSSVAHLALRLFRNRPEYRFEGRIHEQKTHNMPTYLPERFETSSVRILHYGYLKSRISAKEKSQRNIELLEKEALESPGAFVDFNLGSEYIALGEYQRACSYLASSWASVRQEENWAARGYTPMLAARYAQAQRETGNPVSARATIDEALVAFPEHTELVLQAAMCARDQGDLDAAVALAERCLAMGDAPTRHSATVGAGTYLAHTLLAELLTMKGESEQAEEQYLTALRTHPGYTAPILPLTTLRVARGAGVDPFTAELAAERPSAALFVATALYEGGATEEAETWFRRVLEQQPSHGVARIGLVETLLAQRRYPEAATEAALEPEGSVVAGPAATARLFALAAGGDAPGLGAALRDTPASPPELELFGAWQARLAGREAPHRLSPDTAKVAVVALEALLRVRDFAAFEHLHALLARTAIDARARRELLAGIYFRRGFLDSAAEEWIAAATTKPDAAAYVGLAQVALAKGLRDDALTFTAEALALEPENAAANRLREAA